MRTSEKLVDPYALPDDLLTPFLDVIPGVSSGPIRSRATGDEVLGPIYRIDIVVPTLTVGFVLAAAEAQRVVAGPGAGDDGMSVAAMLETLRTIKAGPPPRNDLIFVFNDGEEAGLIGSTAFVEQHPWTKDVGAVFDFDRSDGRGAVILSWTAAHDGWLVREIADASLGIIATSADNDSERQEHENDLHAYAAAGFTGAHFDNVSGSTRYHAMGDNLANADPRALQDEGTAMVAVVRHFGSIPLSETKSEDEVFFALFRRGIVHYPLAWALPLALLAFLGTAGVIAFGLRRAS